MDKLNIGGKKQWLLNWTMVDVLFGEVDVYPGEINISFTPPTEQLDVSYMKRPNCLKVTENWFDNAY